MKATYGLTVAAFIMPALCLSCLNGVNGVPPRLSVSAGGAQSPKIVSDLPQSTYGSSLPKDPRGTNTSSDAVVDWSPPKSEVHPLPLDYLTRLNDPDFATMWSFNFSYDDPSNPPRWIDFYAIYSPRSNKVWLSGNTIDPNVSYSDFYLPSPQPFLDLVDYLSAHSDLFFNHDEFSKGVDSVDRFFAFAAHGIGEEYIIAKYMSPHGTTPPEVEYVMNHIITDLMLVSLPPNHDPVCSLAGVNSVTTPEGVPVDIQFDATGTTDLDFDPLTFSWDFDGDSVFGEDPDDAYTGDPNNPTHTYDLPVGVHDVTVSVKVTDPDNAESTCSTSFTITVQ